MKAKIIGIMMLTSLLCGCGNVATNGTSKPVATTTATTATSSTSTSTTTETTTVAADSQTAAAPAAGQAAQTPAQTPAATQAPAANGTTSYYSGMTKEQWDAFTQTDEFKNDMAEQSAGYTALAAAGDGYKIVSSEKVFDSSGSPVYRVGLMKLDGSDNNVYYYYANERYCLTEAQWMGTDTNTNSADAAKQDAQAEQTWEQYYKSEEHKQLMDAQAASDYVLNCVGVNAFMTASCDMVYDSKNNVVYRVGVKPLDPDLEQTITFYYTNGNYCITEAQWFGY